MEAIVKLACLPAWRPRRDPRLQRHSVTHHIPELLGKIVDRLTGPIIAQSVHHDRPSPQQLRLDAPRAPLRSGRLLDFGRGMWRSNRSNRRRGG
jgi:hypothetical protein